MSITRDEWLSELERVMTAGSSDDGYRVEELAELTGHSTAYVRRLLGKMRDRLVVGRRRVVCLSGNYSTVPCYSLKPSEMPRGDEAA